MSRLAALLADDDTDRVVCFGRDGREWRAAELIAVAAQVAGRLRGFDGERWALNLDDSFDFTAALLGCWAAGRTAVLAPRPLLASLDSAAFDGVIELAGDSTAAAGRIVWEELAPTRQPLGAIVSSASLVLYTSGSTGTPKQTHRRLVNVESELAALESVWGTDLVERARIRDRFSSPRLRVLVPDPVAAALAPAIRSVRFRVSRAAARAREPRQRTRLEPRGPAACST